MIGVVSCRRYYRFGFSPCRIGKDGQQVDGKPRDYGLTWGIDKAPARIKTDDSEKKIENRSSGEKTSVFECNVSE